MTAARVQSVQNVRGDGGRLFAWRREAVRRVKMGGLPYKSSRFWWPRTRKKFDQVPNLGILTQNCRRRSSAEVHLGNPGYLNGKLISQWKTDYSDMGGYTLKDKNALGLAANNTLTKFYRVEVTEITGSGTVGRENPGP